MQSQVRFNKVPEKVPEKVGEALVQSQVKFNRVPEKVREKVPEKPSCKAKSGSTEVLTGGGGFGAEPGQGQQGSGEGSGEGSREGLGYDVCSTGFRRMFWRRPWCKAKSGSTGFRRRFRRRSGRLWCRAR